MYDPKYPYIEVALSDTDGDHSSITHAIRRAMKRGGIPPAEIAKFIKEARTSSYDTFLRTCMKWVEIC